MNSKKFDCVKMQREIREELSQKWWNSPELMKKDLEAIRKKYGFKSTKHDAVTAV